MSRHVPEKRLKDHRGKTLFLLSLLNKIVIVLVLAMLLHQLHLKNGTVPVIDSSPEQSHPYPTNAANPNSQPAASTFEVPSITPVQATSPSVLEESVVGWVKIKAAAEIRTEPDGNKPVLLEAATGEAFPVVKQSGEWTEVRLNAKQQGWLPVSQTIDFQTSKMDTQLLLIKADTPLYWGPDESFGKAKLLTANTSLTPNEISGQWILLLEQEHGKPLWVKTNQVEWTFGEQPSREAFSRDLNDPFSGATVRSMPLTGKTIVVDPGHGGIDTGAIAKIKPVYERDVNLVSAQVLVNKLKAGGAHVIMTRTGNDQFVSKAQRVQISNDNKADVFVSIHQNMYQKDPTISGTITYYDSANSKRLANEIEIATSRQLNSRHEDKHVEKEQLYVLKHNRRPSVLIEGCFLSNPSELAASLLPAYQEKLAAGIYEGIVAFLRN
ncbi:N-acetylmuramoyl-L-alanine amidase [Paenibacillus sp. GP183]|uniref:N-acetylmuramoyl-L-alanine amidase n=1 Tax=Paenibacillus sp. GP183 TaxID=1882751 RepID=UPI000895F3C1|nr:N-acetylmuramoyl-L-alanine amidase [Paenibacillus sp. GP183]SED15323.1 N-acetylmuramoyl-L-alanine amidase [Paenibacillus sp. GP183]